MGWTCLSRHSNRRRTLSNPDGMSRVLLVPVGCPQDVLSRQPTIRHPSNGFIHACRKDTTHRPTRVSYVDVSDLRAQGLAPRRARISLLIAGSSRRRDGLIRVQFPRVLGTQIKRRQFGTGCPRPPRGDGDPRNLHQERNLFRNASGPWCGFDSSLACRRRGQRRLTHQPESGLRHQGERKWLPDMENSLGARQRDALGR